VEEELFLLFFHLQVSKKEFRSKTLKCRFQGNLTVMASRKLRLEGWQYAYLGAEVTKVSAKINFTSLSSSRPLQAPW
jgi:hypothetical protein